MATRRQHSAAFKAKRPWRPCGRPDAKRTGIGVRRAPGADRAKDVLQHWSNRAILGNAEGDFATGSPGQDQANAAAPGTASLA